MFDNLFTVENLLNVLGTFAYLFGELFLLFIAISFFVACCKCGCRRTASSASSLVPTRSPTPCSARRSGR